MLARAMRRPGPRPMEATMSDFVVVMVGWGTEGLLGLAQMIAAGWW